MLVRPMRNYLDARRPKGYWAYLENRRHFFEEFAKEGGFDPLLPESWHNVTASQIRSKKVQPPPPKLFHFKRYESDTYNLKGASLLSLFDGSLHNALAQTFPELQFTFQGRTTYS